MNEDVTIENSNVVETPEVEVKDASVESEVVESSVEDNDKEVDPLKRLEEIQKNYEALEKKVKRQKAAYHTLQKKYEGTNEQLEQFKVESPKQDIEEPKIDNFDTLEEFNVARDKYIEDKTRRAMEQELEQKMQQEQFQAQQAHRNQVYEQSKKASLEKYPDFVRAESEVNEFIIEAAKNVPTAVGDSIAEQLYEDPETLTDVIYYFGANNGERIEELAEISRQSPRKAAIEIYKLQQRLRGSSPKTKKETLPKPAKRVNATGSSKRDLMKGDVLKNLGLKK